MVFLLKTAVLLSLLTGFYGWLTNQPAIAVPYGIINPLILLAISWLAQKTSHRQSVETLAAAILLINIPGSVYLHKIGIQYDVPLHFLVSFWSFEILALFLKDFFPNSRFVYSTAFALIIVGGLGFEGLQKSSDLIFNTQLFFDAAQPISLDFTVDLIMDTLGGLAGWLKIKSTF